MKRLLAAATASIALALAYRRWLRAWVLNWGATPQEIEQRLPGDELLETPDLVSTRAVTIEAPPSAVWPWLVQMGPGRAGAYTYHRSALTPRWLPVAQRGSLSQPRLMDEVAPISGAGQSSCSCLSAVAATPTRRRRPRPRPRGRR